MLTQMSFKELRLHLDTLTLALRRTTDTEWHRYLLRAHARVAQELDDRLETERTNEHA